MTIFILIHNKFFNEVKTLTLTEFEAKEVRIDIIIKKGDWDDMKAISGRFEVKVRKLGVPLTVLQNNEPNTLKECLKEGFVSDIYGAFDQEDRCFGLANLDDLAEL